MKEVLVNGVNMKFHDSITEEMIVNFLASNEETMPKFIFVQVMDYRNNGSIQYQTLKKEFKTTKNASDLKKIIKEIADKYQLTSLDIIKYWIYTTIGNNKPTLIFMKALQDSFSNELNISPNVDSVKEWNHITHLNIKANTDSVKELQKKLESIEEVTTTEYDVVGDDLILKVTTSKNVLEILDNMTLSERIPFASAKTYINSGLLGINSLESSQDRIVKIFHKLDTRLDFYDSWLDSNEKFVVNSIKFFMDNTSGYKKVYTTAVWDFNTGLLYAETDVKSGLTRDKFIELLQNTFHVKNITVASSSTHGYIIVPNVHLNIPIFLDVIFNDTSFSNFFYMDEHEKTSLDKKHFTIYYNPSRDAHEGPNTIHFGIIHKEANQGVYGMESGAKYVEIHIREARNTDVVNRFRNNLSLLISMYQSRVEEIGKIYTRYIKDIGEITFRIRGRKKAHDTSLISMLRQMYPDMFAYKATEVPGDGRIKPGTVWSRICQKNHQVKPISVMSEEDRIKLQTELQRDIIEFPDNSGRYFYCPHDKHKFVGAKATGRTKLYPYLPCCYASQKDAGNSMAIARGQSAIAKVQSTAFIKSTTKPLQPNRIGDIPQHLKTIFKPCGVRELARMGVSIPEHPDNFLKAIRIGLGLKIDEDKMREKLAQMNHELSIGKQEMYDMSIKDIQNLLMDPMANLDPEKFVRICEYAFDCNIIFFRESEVAPETFYFAKPRHCMFYIPAPRNYEHPILVMWLRSEYKDNIKINYVELLVQGKGNSIKYKFSALTNTGALLNLQMLAFDYNSYKEEKKTKILKNNNITAQIIDNYGKRRGLIYYDKITVQTAPSFPLPIPNKQVIKCDVADIIELTDVNTVLTRFGNTVGVSTKYGLIPCTFNSKVLNVPIEEAPSMFYITPEGTLRDYDNMREMQRIASYLFQNYLYLLSTYKDDIMDHILLTENFDYNLDMFSYNVRGAMRLQRVYKDDKLIFSSQILLDRATQWGASLLSISPQFIELFTKDSSRYLDYYMYPHDFKTNTDIKVFVNNEDLLAYRMGLSPIRIYTADTIPFGISPPYLVKTPDGEMQLITLE